MHLALVSQGQFSLAKHNDFKKHLVLGRLGTVMISEADVGAPPTFAPLSFATEAGFIKN